MRLFTSTRWSQCLQVSCVALLLPAIPASLQLLAQAQGKDVPWNTRPYYPWGRHDLSFDPGEPERYRQDVPNAQVHVLDAGHFALDTAAEEIAALVRDSVTSSR